MTEPASLLCFFLCPLPTSTCGPKNLPSFPKPLPDFLSHRGFLTLTELLGLLLELLITCRQLLAYFQSFLPPETDYSFFLPSERCQKNSAQKVQISTFEQMFLLINRVKKLGILSKGWVSAGVPNPQHWSAGC